MKTFRRFLVFALPLAMLAACSSESGDNPVFDNLPDAEPITLRNGEKVQTDNVFAFDLLRTTYKHADGANTFISPLSMSMALNMTLNGAAGQTADEMKSALRESGYSMEEINEYCRTLREALLKVDPSTTIGIANSIWYRDKDFSVKDAFIKVNQVSYDAEVRPLDFASPAAVKIINDWCAKKTNNKIKDVLDKIPSEAMMYLINAIYFKGIWAHRFKKDDTHDGKFRLASGAMKTVKMMEQTDGFNYAADENAQYLEMDYGNKAFSMVVMLPNEGKTVEDVVELLDNDRWNNAVKQLHGQKVRVRLPRFKAELKYAMEQKILPELGMRIPFSNNADFSGISEIRTKISRVIHQTFVQVDEEGTEAAAVTVVEMEFTSAMPSEPRIIDYHVDKPFAFAIREKSTGVILFMGTIGEIGG